MRELLRCGRRGLRRGGVVARGVVFVLVMGVGSNGVSGGVYGAGQKGVVNSRVHNQGGETRLVVEDEYYQLFTRYGVLWETGGGGSGSRWGAAGERLEVDGGVDLTIDPVGVAVGPLRGTGVAGGRGFRPLAYSMRSDAAMQRTGIGLEKGIDSTYRYGVRGMYSHEGGFDLIVAGSFLDGGALNSTDPRDNWQLQVGTGLPVTENITLGLWNSYISAPRESTDDKWFVDDFVFPGIDIFHHALTIDIRRAAGGLAVVGGVYGQWGLWQSPQFAATVVLRAGEKPHYWGVGGGGATLLYVDEHGEYNREGLRAELWYRYNPADIIEIALSGLGVVYGNYTNFPQGYYDVRNLFTEYTGRWRGAVGVGEYSTLAWGVGVEYAFDGRPDSAPLHDFSLEPELSITWDTGQVEVSVQAGYELDIEEWETYTHKTRGAVGVKPGVFTIELTGKNQYDEATGDSTWEAGLAAKIDPPWGGVSGKVIVDDFAQITWEDIRVEIGVDLGW